jgi:thiol-disulfide isomerase/thioredoxin
MRPRPTVLPGLLLAGTLVLSACSGLGGTGGTSGGEGGKGYVSGDGKALRFPAAERPAAPRIQGPTLDGTTLDLATLRGKVVVLNIWGSWCAPCRQEAPTLERMSRQTRAQGVEFVGLNIRDVDDRARAFERSFSVTYPSIVDAEGVIQSRFRGKIAAAAMPTTYIIDREGRVAARANDTLTDVKLRELLNPVLAEG